MCSGGFDPLHIGHLQYLKAASRFGLVIVAVNSDAWLERKKGYVFMPWEERFEIVSSLQCIYGTAYPVDDDDDTVCEVLRLFRPDFFANGGDRTIANPAEAAVCAEFGIRQLFGIGGGKIAASSKLVEMARLSSLAPHIA